MELMVNATVTLKDEAPASASVRSRTVRLSCPDCGHESTEELDQDGED